MQVKATGGILLITLIAVTVCSAARVFAAEARHESIVLAGGCFWGMQAVFQHVKGVNEAISGYAGGDAKDAKYEVVGTGATGHAESVKVTYDPSQVTLQQLLDVYFNVAHNPTQLNYQGPDHGSQYRSTIFYADAAQKAVAEEAIADLQKKKTFHAPVFTTLEPLRGFYAAEDYHQNFATLHPNHPYIVVHDAPKLVALQKTYPELYMK